MAIPNPELRREGLRAFAQYGFELRSAHGVVAEGKLDHSEGGTLVENENPRTSEVRSVRASPRQDGHLLGQIDDGHLKRSEFPLRGRSVRTVI
jgi:hypothetical protein